MEAITLQSGKAMAPHSSTLAWKIPWMEESGELQSMRSIGVGHDWATSLSLFTFMHWRRKWQPTPVFLPGESQGRGSLVGCRLWGRTESDMTEVCPTDTLKWLSITLQYCGSFCHTATWVSHGCTCVLPSWMPLPLGCPRAPALSALLLSNLHWSSILHMVMKFLTPMFFDQLPPYCKGKTYKIIIRLFWKVYAKKIVPFI